MFTSTQERERLLQQALKTQDPAKLFSLFEQALELAQFEAGRGELSRGRELKLKEQIARQAQMIDNLEKTLHKK